LLFPESGPKKKLSGNGFTKTVTPHLRSIVPNVQRHMAYFASVTRTRYFNTGWRPVFPGSSRLEIEPKTPGWLVMVQAQPTAQRGSGALPGRDRTREEPGTLTQVGAPQITIFPALVLIYRPRNVHL
jgi:hypothetical protein